MADGGNAFASFLLGYMATNTVTRSPIFDWRSAYSGVFVQDDWRLTSKLTVNLGLRWDYEAPLTEQGNQVNGGFDPNALALVCAACPASGLPQNLLGGLTFADGAFYSRDRNNFGPRAGLHLSGEQQARRARRLRADVSSIPRPIAARRPASREGRPTSRRSTATGRRRTGWRIRIRTAC